MKHITYNGDECPCASSACADDCPACLASQSHVPNPTPHLNRARVKQTALELAAATRAQGFTRVGKSFLERIEAQTRAAIAREVRQHPSRGKTLL